MYLKNKDVIVKKRNNAYFGLNLVSGTTFEMNESLFDIINFFENDSEKEIEDLLKYLANIYDININDIVDDVNQAVKKLTEEQILLEV